MCNAHASYLAHCAMHIAHCTLQIAHCTLHIVQCAETQLVQNMVDRDIGLDINETASIWSTPTSQANISLSMLGKK